MKHLTTILAAVLIIVAFVIVGLGIYYTISNNQDYIGLVTVLGTAAIILLSMLGCWIGIGKDIFIYLAAFYIFWKAWGVLTWVVDRIDDKN